jgi:hypothetical protein
MIRRSGSFSLRRGDGGEAEIANPLETLANLTDVWIVLAVALMMALVAHWGVDMTSTVNVSAFDESALTELDPDFDLGALQEEGESDSAYEEMGMAYRDADGRVYIVQEP